MRKKKFVIKCLGVLFLLFCIFFVTENSAARRRSVRQEASDGTQLYLSPIDPVVSVGDVIGVSGMVYNSTGTVRGYTFNYDSRCFNLTDGPYWIPIANGYALVASLKVNDFDFSAYQCSFNIGGTSGGPYIYKYSYPDISPVAKISPETAEYVIDPAQHIEFDVSASYDPDGDISAESYDCGAARLTGQFPSLHKFWCTVDVPILDNFYEATVIVTDNEGHTDSAKAIVTLADGGGGGGGGGGPTGPNTLTFTGPDTITPGETVTLDLTFNIGEDGWFQNPRVYVDLPPVSHIECKSASRVTVYQASPQPTISSAGACCRDIRAGEDSANCTPGVYYSSWSRADSILGPMQRPSTFTTEVQVNGCPLYPIKVAFKEGTKTVDETTWDPQCLTLSVSLSANPSSGTAPLIGVDLTADVSGSATGPMNYKFDCTNDGTWDYTLDGITDNPKTVQDACDYPSQGTYTAKVLVERQGLTKTDTTDVVVQAPSNNPPYVPQKLSPAGGASDIDSSSVILQWRETRVDGKLDPDGDPVTYDVYLTTNPADWSRKVCAGLSSTSCTVTSLNPSTTYYWNVVAVDEQGAQSHQPSCDNPAACQTLR